MLPEGVRRVFRLGRPSDVERDVDAELAFHLDARTQALIAGGMSPAAAREEALRQFGDVRRVREELIRVDRGEAVKRQRREWCGDWWLDVRHAARGLRRTPAFTATVAVMLGLGLGAAAAMYGILDRLLLRAPEHVQDPDRLFAAYITGPSFGGAEGTRGFMQWREYRLLTDGVAAVATAAAASEPSGEAVTIGADQLRVRSVMASVGYFGVLGVRPAAGRFFLPEDSAAAATPVAVIGDGFWRRRFGADPAALGRTISKDGRTYTIVGVAPRGFSGATPEQVDVWLPAEHAAAAAFGSEWHENNFVWQVIARVRERGAATRAAAEGLARLKAAPRSQRYVVPGYTRVQFASIVPGRAPTGPTRRLRLSYLVGGAAAVVALIALANAAGLLLLRALRRRRETAVRLVLGVSRGRLLRSVALESVLLALLGGAVACAVAAAGGELLRKLLLRVDWAVPVADPRVALLTLGASLVIGFLTGLVPGWLAGRPETLAALKSGVRDTGSDRVPARAALLVVQGALSLVLLAGLALYLRSFARARAFDFGVDVDRLLVAELQEWTPEWRGPVLPAVSAEAAARVAALPGVQAVAVASATPLLGSVGVPVRAEGVDSLPRTRPGFYVVEVSANYFAATGLGLVRGRLFAHEGPGGPREAVVSEEMARVLWPASQAIGRCLYVGRNAMQCTTIVGVVRAVRERLNDAERRLGLTYYIPLAHAVSGLGGKALIVRADAPGRLAPAVREIVAASAGVRGPDGVRTLREIVDPQYRPLRQGMALFGILAGLAVVVTMIGLYSVVAYSVTQRAHEFGIRVAVGARAGDLVRLVLAQALRYAALGVALGVVLAIVGARYIAPLLYETSPRDPVSLSVAALTLMLAALAACVIPALSAARADPRQALQAE